MSEELEKNTATPAAEEAAPAEAPAEKEHIPSMDDIGEALENSYKALNIREGDVLTGSVIGVSEAEVTVDLGFTEGIIRLEDYSNDPSFTLNSVKVGDSVTATFLRRDKEGRILLSAKEATEALAWAKLKQYLEEKTPVTVKVSGVVKSGVVAYLEGVRGFIPASKLALGYVEDLNEYLGRELSVQVITVEEEGKRLVLSARELLREEEAKERKARISNVQVGLVTEGTVETVKDYGAFINLGGGLSGLVHVSQISNKRVKSPSAVLKVGDKVKVKVIAVKDGKLSLSMKALEEVAAEEITEEAYDLPQSESLTTGLGSLLAKIKL